MELAHIQVPDFVIRHKLPRGSTTADRPYDLGALEVTISDVAVTPASGRVLVAFMIKNVRDETGRTNIQLGYCHAYLAESTVTNVPDISVKTIIANAIRQVVATMLPENPEIQSV